MTFLNYITGIICAVFLSASACAQLIWSAPVLMVDSGNVVSVDFSVSGYENVISAQGTIQFDPLILEYIDVDNFALPSISSSSFGETQVDAGRLSFSWYESDLIGKDITDGATVITVYFNVIGNPGEISDIELVDQPVITEFIDEAFDPIAHSSETGSVTINGLSNVTENQLVKETSVFPNPATDWIVLEGDMSDVNLEIAWYTMTGDLIKKEAYFTMGSSIQLSVKELTQGTYIMRVGANGIGFDNHLIQIL